jgi:hypothetical protein
VSNRKPTDCLLKLQKFADLFTRRASVHVDFHAHWHFNDLWSFPGHFALLANSILRLGSRCPVIEQVNMETAKSDVQFCPYSAQNCYQPTLDCRAA